jgi:hypothetical protein
VAGEFLFEAFDLGEWRMGTFYYMRMRKPRRWRRWGLGS